MRTIYLIRHGEPLLTDGKKRFLGQTDTPLGERGKQQAQRLARHFRKISLTGIYASALSRSLETARIMAVDKWPVATVEGFEELNAGDWDGLDFDEIKKKYPELYRLRQENPAKIPPPMGETWYEGLCRFEEALKKLLNYTSGDIAIVGHRGINSVLLCSVLGRPLEEAFSIPQPYACVNTLVWDGHKLTVLETGVMCDLYPGPEERDRLFRLYETPEPVIRHCRAVARKAAQMAGELEAAGCSFDKRLLREAALIHDFARLQPKHARLGAEILVEEGYPQVAALVASHHGVGLKDTGTINEADILFLADKLVQGTRTVTLEERFAASRQKCVTFEAMSAHERQSKEAYRLMERYNKLLERKKANEKVI